MAWQAVGEGVAGSAARDGGAFIATLMGAEADAVWGAAYGTVSQQRVNRRTGYRHRDLDTRVGTLDVAIPKLRADSYFPGWLLTPRPRVERRWSAAP
jgi:transposase-like protein